MKKTIILSLVLASLSSYASDFSAEELVGTYQSKDKLVEISVNKNLVAAPTLFDPAKYDYDVDIKFNAGECMDMYGDEQFVEIEDLELSYNGSWKPTEYLTAGRSGDNPGYDGYIWIDDTNFTATKISKDDGTSSVSLSFDFSISHTPDYSDGEDGGEEVFDNCYNNTKTSWDDLIKIN